MSSENQKKQKSSKWIALLVLIALILLILFWARSCKSAEVPAAPLSSSSSVESPAPSSSAPTEEKLSSGSSSSVRTKISSAEALSHGVVAKSSAASRAELNPPKDWGVEPIPGIYREKIAIQFHCENEKKCQFKILNQGNKVLNDGESLVLSQSAQLQVQALDSFGNASASKTFAYQIQKRSDRCPANMVPVGNGPSFCMDTYEWPNQKGAKPRTDVSLKEAMDYCKSVSKELCSSEQWTAACQSNQSNSYAYGSSYEENYCNTASQSAERSGYKANCRSWDGVYDLSGNVWEWTSTPARNKNYNLVAGGSWDSRSGSACGERKYSFFPQNQYPMVGFRCCKSAQ